MLRKDFRMLCLLYGLDEKKSLNLIENNTYKYFSLIKNKLDLNILQNVLNNIAYINHEIRTKEGKTLIAEVTEDEFLNIKNFDLKHLINECCLCETGLEIYKSRRTIINMIIPKIYIKYSEIYDTERYNNLIDKLYS